MAAITLNKYRAFELGILMREKMINTHQRKRRSIVSSRWKTFIFKTSMQANAYLRKVSNKVVGRKVLQRSKTKVTQSCISNQSKQKRRVQVQPVLKSIKESKILRIRCRSPELRISRDTQRKWKCRQKKRNRNRDRKKRRSRLCMSIFRWRSAEQHRQ